MERKSELKYESQVIIERNENIFVLSIPEWGIKAENSDLSAAYRDIENQQNAIREQYIKAGLESELPKPGSTPAFSKSKKNPGNSNMMGTVILVVSLIFICFFVFQKIENYEQLFSQTWKEINSPSPRALGKMATRMLVKTARVLEVMTVEERAQVRESIRTIVLQLQSLGIDIEAQSIANQEDNVDSDDRIPVSIPQRN